MPADQNVLHALLLKAFKQFQQWIGGRTHAIGSGSTLIQAARSFDPARLVEPLELGMRAAKNAAWMRRSRLGEHPVQSPSAMPRLDRVEHEFRAILRTNDPRHGGIIA